LIAKLYMGQRAVVRIDGELPGYCIIGQGVRQGCPLSLLLFNLYIQYVINEALEDIQEAVKVGDVLIPAIQFADDQAMISHSVRRLQVIMDALQDTSEKYMKINTKKTKIMRMSMVEGRTMKIIVNGQNLERVKQFCYLGSLVVTEDCRSCHDVRRRIALGKKRGFQQEKRPHVRIPQPSLEETYVESICLECCIVWKRNMNSTQRRYSAT